MKTAALWFSLVLLLIVFLGALRTIFERRRPFARAFNDETRQAYILLLVIAGTGFFVWAQLDLRIDLSRSQV